MKNSIKIGNIRYKKYQGASWLLIFHHKADKATFIDESEALNCQEENKFSILGFMNSTGNSYKYEGKFEFLLEYKNENNIIRWRQTNFPLNQSEIIVNSDTVEGFENKTVLSEENPFTGLARTEYQLTKNDTLYIPSLLNGMVNNAMWWFAVGSYNKQSGFEDKIPSVYGINSKEESLWIRVPNIKGNINNSPCKRITSTCSILFIEIILLVY